MKRYILVLLLFLITLTCVSAEDVSQDDSNNLLDNTQNMIVASGVNDLKSDVTHHVDNNEKLHAVVSDLNNIRENQSHVIELDDDLSIDEDIDNGHLKLIINGNNNQLTVNNLKFSNAVSVTLNNLSLELNNNIDNYVNLNLNNVTVKSTYLYDNITKTLTDNGITVYTENNYENVNNMFYGVNTNHGNIQNYNTLTVNNSVFTKTIAHTGSAIYNHGILSVNNTLFNDTLSIYGVVYSGGSLTVTNSKFTNNRQYGYLLHSDSGDITCINNSFENNYALYNSGVSGNAKTLVENCNFTNNTASDMNSVSNYGNMTVKGCIFKYNNGLVMDNIGNLTVYNCTFEDNNNTRDRGYIIFSNYIYDGVTGEIIHIPNLVLVNNTFGYNTCDKLIYNGASISLLNNTIMNISNVLEQANPGDYILNEIMRDILTTMFNRSMSIELNTFIIDSGVTDEIMINNQTNYIQYRPRNSKITLVEMVNVTVGNSIIISGYLTDSNNNAIVDIVNINISDYADSIEATDENGYFIYECTPPVGLYEVQVSYNHKPYINPYTVTTSFTVTDIDNQVDDNKTNESDINDTPEVNDTVDDNNQGNASYVNDTSNINMTDMNNTLDSNSTDVNNTNMNETNNTDLHENMNNTDITGYNQNNTDTNTTNNDQNDETNITDNNNTDVNSNVTDTDSTCNDLNNNTKPELDPNNTSIDNQGNNQTDSKPQNHNAQKQSNKNNPLTTTTNKMQKHFTDNIKVNPTGDDKTNDTIINEGDAPETADNPADSDTSNQNNNQNNQLNNTIPIVIALVVLMAIIGVVVIKK